MKITARDIDSTSEEIMQLLILRPKPIRDIAKSVKIPIATVPSLNRLRSSGYVTTYYSPFEARKLYYLTEDGLVVARDLEAKRSAK